jgi:hypothetical protein
MSNKKKWQKTRRSYRIWREQQRRWVNTIIGSGPDRMLRTLSPARFRELLVGLRMLGA